MHYKKKRGSLYTIIYRASVATHIAGNREAAKNGGLIMVIDKIENAQRYYSLHPEFKAVFEGLAQLTPESEMKKYEIDGEKAFFSVSEYENMPVAECGFEAHKKYIDIQFVISGHEHIDVTDAAALEVTEDFVPGGDVAFYADSDKFSVADLGAGDFVILFPGEAHRPLVAPDGKPVKTIKAVAKIAAE